MDVMHGLHHLKYDLYWNVISWFVFKTQFEHFMHDFFWSHTLSHFMSFITLHALVKINDSKKYKVPKFNENINLGW